MSGGLFSGVSRHDSHEIASYYLDTYGRFSSAIHASDPTQTTYNFTFFYDEKFYTDNYIIVRGSPKLDDEKKAVQYMAAMTVLALCMAQSEETNRIPKEIVECMKRFVYERSGVTTTLVTQGGGGENSNPLSGREHGLLFPDIQDTHYSLGHPLIVSMLAWLRGNPAQEKFHTCSPRDISRCSVRRGPNVVPMSSMPSTMPASFAPPAPHPPPTIVDPLTDRNQAESLLAGLNINYE
jgi:hypothetical protein